GRGHLRRGECGSAHPAADDLPPDPAHDLCLAGRALRPRCGGAEGPRLRLAPPRTTNISTRQHPRPTWGLPFLRSRAPCLSTLSTPRFSSPPTTWCYGFC